MLSYTKALVNYRLPVFPASFFLESDQSQNPANGCYLPRIRPSLDIRNTALSMYKTILASIHSKLFTKSICVILYFLITSAAIFYFFRNWAYDDPFITYRYARNIVNGVGFVYNPGEHVLSTTTPLFTLILSALSPFYNNLPRLAILIGALSLSLGALLLYWMANIHHEPVVGWASLLLYPTSPLLLVCLGSETPLYIAFCLACFIFYWRSNYMLTAIFSALAILTRPDGLLVPVILAADYLIRIRRPIPWKPVLLFLALALPWFIFSWVYYGSPIPATLAAKQHQGMMAISQRFAAGFFTQLKTFYMSWFYEIQAVVAFFGIYYLVMKSRRWFLFFVWPVVYFITFVLLGMTRYFWYYAPLLPGFVILVGLGLVSIAWLTRLALDKGFNSVSLPKKLPQLAMLALLLVLGIFQILHLKAIAANRDPRYTIYKAIGNWLNANTPPGVSVGTLEVGIIGYYSQRPIIDFAGLIQPAIAERLERHTTYADAANYAVMRFEPDYLVIREGVFPDLEEGYAPRRCHIAQRFQGASYNYANNLLVYECNKAQK
jgi:hypothetical protein